MRNKTMILSVLLALVTLFNGCGSGGGEEIDPNQETILPLSEGRWEFVIDEGDFHQVVTLDIHSGENEIDCITYAISNVVCDGVECWTSAAYSNHVAVTTVQGVNAIDVSVAFHLGGQQAPYHAYGFEGTHNGVTAAGLATVWYHPVNQAEYYNFTARKL